MTSSVATPSIHVERTRTPRPKPKETELGFGRHFADHMFIADYVAGRGWTAPRVVPYAPFSLEPAAMVFHYGQAMFEGLKAFRLPDGQVALFRVDRHCQRMAKGAPWLSMPAPDPDFLQSAIVTLVATDREWVPASRGTALYVRPTLIATQPSLGVRPSETYSLFVITSPVGAYYTGGLKPVRIWVERERVRAVRGGIGAVKAAGNYAASLQVAEHAREKGCDQVLWLDAAERRFVEEVGTMNVFLVIGNELITPPLTGSILAGITRDAVITLARDWGLAVAERPIALDEVEAAHRNGLLKEAFGTGTAAVIQSVGTLVYDGGELMIGDGRTGSLAQRLYDAITRLQYGDDPDPHDWRTIVSMPSA
ncbi:MAG: branched-chain amino acid aminotransferase [Luteitalea sp.]|nr:branched-chain amino acid aminotransferase [Luteitalea sp.]